MEFQNKLGTRGSAANIEHSTNCHGGPASMRSCIMITDYLVAYWPKGSEFGPSTRNLIADRTCSCMIMQSGSVQTDDGAGGFVNIPSLIRTSPC